MNFLKKAFLTALLAIVVVAPLHSQTYVALDLNEASYSVTNKPIGSTGVTYSLAPLTNNNGGPTSPIGNALGDLELDGTCANCGRSVRLTFSQPVELLISGKQSSSTFFATEDGGPGTGDGFWNVSSSNGTFTVADPNSELTDLNASPFSVTFNGKPICVGAGATPCQAWSISSPSISTVDIAFEANTLGPNGSAIRFRISDVLPPAPIPTLSQWGMIILGLSLLSLGAAVLWKRKSTFAHS